MGGVQRFATQRDVLKESPVVARRLESPMVKIERDEFSSRIQSARRRVAAFHLVRGDERKIISQLRGGDRVDATGVEDRRRDSSTGCAFALPERNRQGDTHSRKQGD